MKLKSILAMAACGLCGALAFTSCQNDGWDVPDMRIPLYGNNEIAEMNVITIADLKKKFATAIDNSTVSDEITEDLQVKARVTGNDVGGNIYKQIIVQDATGAIVVGINRANLYTDIPLGQPVLIDLKGLRVGGYGRQPQIGVVYNGGIGRMDMDTWKKHVKLLGEADESRIEPEEFSTSWNMADKCGTLVKLTGVSVVGFGTQTLAPDDNSVTLTNNCAQRYIEGYKSTVLFTSSYSKIKNVALPDNGQKVNLVGIATRYNNTWQILLRKAEDYEIVDPAN